MRMAEEKSLMKIHPTGEPDEDIVEGRAEPTSVDTFAGKVQVKWMPDSEVSSLGQMAFFIEFLKTSGLLENWIEDCPLKYTSPNAPQARDVLGTVLLSVLAGHWRYAHINAIRGDGVNAQLLGMKKVVSEDSVRRAMIAMNKAAAEQWLKKHLKASYAPLLEEPWALDIDTTVKVLYGHQEDAKVGYNPASQGDDRGGGLGRAQRGGCNRQRAFKVIGGPDRRGGHQRLQPAQDQERLGNRGPRAGHQGRHPPRRIVVQKRARIGPGVDDLGRDSAG